MAAVTYTALREIASGHSISTEYSMDIQVTARRRRRKSNRVDQEALDGSVKVIYKSGVVSYQITSNWIDESTSDVDLWREFLASVEGGEQFTIDLTGSVATPDNPQTAISKEASIDESRQGLTDYVKFSFTAYIPPS